MTISIVQSAAGGIDTGFNATNRSQAFGSSVTSGNVLVCWFSVRDSNPGNLRVTDSQGNSWSRRADSYSDRGVSCWYATAGSSAANTVTVDKQGTVCGVGMSIYELSGVTNISGFFDATDGNAQSVDSGPAQATTGSNNYDHDLIMAGLAMEHTAYATATPLTNYTDSGNGSTNTAIALQHRVITRQTTITGTWTPGWTITAPSHWSVLGVIFRGSTTVPTITGVDDTTPNRQGSLTISGVNFGASQGTVSLGGVNQTVTAWSDTSITVTVSRGTNNYGTAVNLQITTAASVNSNVFTGITGILPQTGWDYVNLVTPNATAADRLTAVGDLQAGYQVAWNTESGLVTVYADASFSADQTVSSFDAEAWDSSGWGSTGTQLLIAAAGSGGGGSGVGEAIVVWF